MRLKEHGHNTSEVEVTNISRHGFWLLIREKEYFLSFDQYPWFKEARIGQILNVQLQHGHLLHWPDLDVDLKTEILETPDQYPLIDKGTKP